MKYRIEKGNLIYDIDVPDELAKFVVEYYFNENAIRSGFKSRFKHNEVLNSELCLLFDVFDDPLLLQNYFNIGRYVILNLKSSMYIGDFRLRLKSFNFDCETNEMIIGLDDFILLSNSYVYDHESNKILIY